MSSFALFNPPPLRFHLETCLQHLFEPEDKTIYSVYGCVMVDSACTPYHWLIPRWWVLILSLAFATTNHTEMSVFTHRSWYFISKFPLAGANFNRYWQLFPRKLHDRHSCKPFSFYPVSEDVRPSQGDAGDTVSCRCIVLCFSLVAGAAGRWSLAPPVSTGQSPPHFLGELFFLICWRSLCVREFTLCSYK